jgi:RHS repeat-associated protein
MNRSSLVALLATALSFSCGTGDGGGGGGDDVELGETTSGLTAKPNVAPPPLVASPSSIGYEPGSGGVNPNGQFTYRIPIAVAPGRAGMQPSLALSYSSDGGPGIAGLGWSLEGGSNISRCGNVPASGGVRSGLEMSAGPYCLDGQLLVLVAGTDGAVGAEYRTEIESYARVKITAAGTDVFGVGPIPLQWVVERKDGLKASYSLDDDDTRLPTVYALKRLADRSGNRVDWDYEPGNGHLLTGALIPVRISYTACGSPSPCPYGTAATRSVTFTYEERPSARDWITVYRDGREHTISRRLVSIKSQVNVSETSAFQWKTYREYRLTYTTNAQTGRSLLASVQAFDSTGGSEVPTIFNYPAPSAPYSISAANKAGTYTYQSNLNGALRGMDVLAYDANGDGNGDIVLREWLDASGGTAATPANAIRTDKLLLGDGAAYVKAPVNVSWKPGAEGRPEGSCYAGHWRAAQPVDLDGSGRKYVIAECDFKYRLLGWNQGAGTIVERAHPDLDEVTMPWWPVNEGLLPPLNPKAESLLMFTDLDGNGIVDMLGVPANTSIVGTTQWQYRLASPATVTTTGSPQVSYGAWTSTSIPLASAPVPSTTPGVSGPGSLPVYGVMRLLDEDGDGHEELVQSDYSNKQRSFTLSPTGVKRYGYRDGSIPTGIAGTQDGTVPSAATVPWWSTPTLQGSADGSGFVCGGWTYVDVNGDGLKDALYRCQTLPVPPSSFVQVRWNLRINTGAGYKEPIAASGTGSELGPGTMTLFAYPGDLLITGGQLVGRDRDNGIRVADLNGDGRDDLVLLDTPGVARTNYTPGGTATRWQGETTGAVVLYANNTGFEAPVQLPAAPTGRIRLAEYAQVFANEYITGNRYPGTTLADLDGDGRVELIELMGSSTALNRALVVTRLTRSDVERITSVTQGTSTFGNYDVVYDRLSTGAPVREPALWTTETHGPVPRMFPQAAVATGLVVRHLRGKPGRVLDEEYTYDGGIANVQGRGFIGFEKVKVLDVVSGVRRTMTYDVTARFDPASPQYYYFPLRGLPVQTSRAAPIATHDPTLANAQGTLPTPNQTLTATFTGRPLRMTSQSTLSSPTTAGNPPTVLSTTNFDALGNATSSTSTFADTLHGRSYTTTATTTYVNDQTNWLIGLPNQRTEQRTVDAGTLPGTERIPDGYARSATLVTTYTHDPATGLVTAVEHGGADGVRSRWNYAHDGAGLLTVTTRLPTGGGGVGRTTSFTYDRFGVSAESITNVFGQKMWVLYDPLLAVPYLEEDVNGVRTTTTHDGFGRVRSMTRGTGESFTKTYPSVRRVQTTYGDGRSEVVDLDLFGRTNRRIWKAFAGNAAVEYTDYDALGNVTKVSYASDTTSFASAVAGSGTVHTLTPTTRYSATYDALGRIATNTNGTTETRTYTYPALDSVRVVDGTSAARTTKSDALGRIVQVTEARDGGAEISTAYYYGAFGTLQRISNLTDTSAITERFLFDPIGRRIGWVTTNNDSSTWATGRIRERVTYNEYDEALTVSTNGVLVTYEHDALGRITRRTFGSPSDATYEQQTFTWDQGTGAAGQLSVAETQGHRVNFTYNSLGQLVTRRETFTGGDASGTSLSFEMTYAPDGRLQTMSYPERSAQDVSSATHTAAPGEQLRYTYQNGLLKGIALTSSPANLNIYTVANRHPYGMVTEAAYARGVSAVTNTVTSTWSYNPNTLRMTGQSATGGVTGPAITQAFGYATDGDLISRTTGGFVETFGYDGSTDFLKSYQRTGPSGSNLAATFTIGAKGFSSVQTTASTASPDWPDVDEAYAYATGTNTTGYRLSTQTLTGATTGTRTFTYDEPHRVLTQTTGAGTRTYAWNSYNLPTRIDDPVATRTFAYDAFGSRTRKSQDATNRVLYVSKLFEQRNLPGQSKTESIYRVFGETGQLFEIAHPWGTTERRIRPVFTDQQGSPTFVVDVAGATTQRGFFPYGKRMGTAPTFTFSSLGYTGHIQDDDLGLVNMEGRIFDISSRRFLTPDIVPDQPQKTFGTLPYAYVGHNPANLFDPSGFQARKPQSGQDVQFDPCAQVGTICHPNGDADVTVTADRVGGGGAGTPGSGGDGWGGDGPDPIEPPTPPTVTPPFRNAISIQMFMEWLGNLGTSQGAATAAPNMFARDAAHSEEVAVRLGSPQMMQIAIAERGFSNVATAEERARGRLMILGIIAIGIGQTYVMGIRMPHPGDPPGGGGGGWGWGRRREPVLGVDLGTEVPSVQPPLRVAHWRGRNFTVRDGKSYYMSSGKTNDAREQNGEDPSKVKGMWYEITGVPKVPRGGDWVGKWWQGSKRDELRPVREWFGRSMDIVEDFGDAQGAGPIVNDWLEAEGAMPARNLGEHDRAGGGMGHK